MRVALVRHTRPLIAAGLCYGRLDVPVHPDAAAATARLAARLAALGTWAVWCSPSVRCRVLAEQVAARTGAVLHVDEQLRELDFGLWEGLPWDAVPRAALDRWAAAPGRFAPPGGERGDALVARVGALHDVLRARGEDCVVVSHGGPLKLLRALLRDRPPDLLAAAPSLGSVEILGSGRQRAQHGAFDRHRDGAEHVAGVAAELPPGDPGDGERGGEG